MLDNFLPGFLGIFSSLVTWMRSTMLIGNLSIFSFFVILVVVSIIFNAFINGSNSKGGNDSGNSKGGNDS